MKADRVPATKRNRQLRSRGRWLRMGAILVLLLAAPQAAHKVFAQAPPAQSKANDSQTNADSSQANADTSQTDPDNSNADTDNQKKADKSQQTDTAPWDVEVPDAPANQPSANSDTPVHSTTNATNVPEVNAPASDAESKRADDAPKSVDAAPNPGDPNEMPKPADANETPKQTDTNQVPKAAEGDQAAKPLEAGDPPKPAEGNEESTAADIPAVPAVPKTEIAEDSANLMKLADNLKAEVDKTTKDTLSVTVVREAAEIEQLAHKMRTK